MGITEKLSITWQILSLLVIATQAYNPNGFYQGPAHYVNDGYPPGYFNDDPGFFDDDLGFYEDHRVGFYADDPDAAIGGWNPHDQWAGGRGRAKCIDIPANLTLCKDISYTQMRVPNLLGHDTLQEVTDQAKSWVPLLGLNCHPNTKLFLCSLFSPVCLDRPIWPCRSLCQAVKDGCVDRMVNYGYPWPDMLRCDKFPLDNGLCINVQKDKKPDERKCKPCNKPATFEIIVDNYCTEEFAMKVSFRGEGVLTSDDDLKLTLSKKRRIYKRGNLKKQDLKVDLIYMEDSATCECETLDEASRNDEFLVMGQKKGDKLFISYILKYNRRDPAQKKAMRIIRKDDVCENGIRGLTQQVKQDVEETKERDGERRRDSERKRDGNRKKNRRNDDEIAETGGSRKSSRRSKDRRSSIVSKDRKQRRLQREKATGS